MEIQTREYLHKNNTMLSNKSEELSEKSSLNKYKPREQGWKSSQLNSEVLIKTSQKQFVKIRRIVIVRKYKKDEENGNMKILKRKFCSTKKKNC